MTCHATYPTLIHILHDNVSNKFQQNELIRESKNDNALITILINEK